MLVFATIFFANTVNAWQLAYANNVLILWLYLCPCVMINEHVFIYKMKPREWFIPQRNTIVFIITYSLLISWNKMKYMLNLNSIPVKIWVSIIKPSLACHAFTVGYYLQKYSER